MDRKQIELVVNTYLDDLSKKIKINKVILFGSALSGQIKKDSDLDLLIISSSFAKMDVGKRFDLLYTSRINPLTRQTAMDIFGLTPNEYQNASDLSVVGEIKEKGKTMEKSLKNF